MGVRELRDLEEGDVKRSWREASILKKGVEGLVVGVDRVVRVVPALDSCLLDSAKIINHSRCSTVVLL